MVERAIYYKHHAQGFYRASSYVLAAFVCNAPLVAMEVKQCGDLSFFLPSSAPSLILLPIWSLDH